MNLEQIRKKFQKAIGLINYSLSQKELEQIINESKQIPLEHLDEYQLKKVVTDVTGVTSFLIVEALDTSDIDHLIKQIEAALSKLDKK